jgi:hypothetical protein
MSALTIQLPDSVVRMASQLAVRAGVSLDQFMASAAAEKVSAMAAPDFLELEASLASREEFERVLRKVAEAPPELGDEP